MCLITGRAVEDTEDKLIVLRCNGQRLNAPFTVTADESGDKQDKQDNAEGAWSNSCNSLHERAIKITSNKMHDIK